MDYRKAQMARDKLCDELDKVIGANLNNAGDLKRMTEITAAIHHLDEVMERTSEMENGGSYGNYGRYYPMYYGGGYGGYGARRGGSGGGGSSNNGGSYGYDGYGARGGGQRRDGMGRYAAGDYAEHLRMAMENAPDEESRQNIERMMRDMR